MSTLSRRGLLAGAAGLAALGTGCGYVSSGSSGNSLRFITNHTAEEASGFQAALRVFQRQHSGVSVNYLNIANGTQFYTKLKTVSVAGDLPDVWFTRTYDIGFNAANKWQIPIDEYVRADHIDTADFWPAELAQMTYQGRLYSLPYDFSNWGVYYNRTMFEKERIPVPTGDWTWQEFFDLAKQFRQTKSGRQIRWGAAFPMQDWFLIGVLKAHGGDTFTADARRCVVNSPTNVDTFRLFAKQFANGNAPIPGATGAGDPFVAGMIAMDVNGSWATQQRRLEIGKRFDWDVVKLPKGPTGRRDITTAGGAWGISKDSKRRDQAWELVKFLAAAPQERAFIGKPIRGIPGLQSVAAEEERIATSTRQPPANFGIFRAEMSQDAVASAYPVFWSEFDTIWTNRVAAIATGTDPAHVLPHLQDDANAAAARYFS